MNLILSLRIKLRKKRFRIFRNLIQEIRLDDKEEIEVIDFGGTEEYWYQIYDVKTNPLNLKITLLNIDLVEKHDGPFNYISSNVCDMNQIADKRFAIGFSNSLIEHVGTVPEQYNAVSEMMRVCHYLYLQTPNFWFPIEPHYKILFVHWFPLPVRLKLLSFLKRTSFCHQLYSYKLNPINLLSYTMMRCLFPVDDFACIKERFLLITKSFVFVSRINKSIENSIQNRTNNFLKQ